TRNWDDIMVFPVPGPPQRRIVLFLGRPPVSSLSSPGIPVGVLEFADGAAAVSAMRLSKPPASPRKHIRSDTLTFTNRVHLAHIIEDSVRLTEESETGPTRRRQ